MVYDKFKKQIQDFELQQFSNDKSLYHYTDSSNLVSILLSKELYFKEISDFDDKREFKYTLEVFEETLKNPELSLDKDFKKNIEEKCLQFLTNANFIKMKKNIDLLL